MKIKIQKGIVYQTPPVPRKEEILYHDYPKEEQYFGSNWQDNELLKVPRDYDETYSSKYEYFKLIGKWNNWCSNGCWFMNYGVPTYVNGVHFEHMTINLFHGQRRMRYTESQRDDFYLREIVQKSKELKGVLWLVPRRYGIKSEEVSSIIYSFNSEIKYDVGIQCSSSEYTKKVYMQPLIEVYDKRPFWAKIDFYKPNGKLPRMSLTTNNKVKKVNAFSSDILAMDGGEYDYAILDNVPSSENIDVALKTIINPNRQGKISICGNDFASYNKDGIVKRFISGVHSMYMPEEMTANKYGKVDIKKNTEWVKEQVKSDKLNKKRLPLSIKDLL